MNDHFSPQTVYENDSFNIIDLFNLVKLFIWIRFSTRRHLKECLKMSTKVLFLLVFLICQIFIIFSREPRLYKRVCPSVGPSVRRSVGW